MKKGFMTTSMLILALAGLVGLSTGSSHAADNNAKTADLLFVQNANAAVIDGGKLTLKGIGPTVLFFSDRPQRIAGHMTNERYLRLWTEDGKDSFLKDPPNATVSVLENEQAGDLVVTLRNPKLNGDELTYDISVIEGKLPENGGPCAVFIDIIGMPLTPVSYAGVARRATRRAVYRRW